VKINLELAPDTVTSWDVPHNLVPHVNCLYR